MPTTSGPHPGDERALASLTAAIGYGGIQATVLSALALVISGFSLYESSFKTAEIEVYVPPVVQYARDGGGDTEVFVVPVTITNSGARTGTVLSMELNVEDLKSHKTKRYYSAFLESIRSTPTPPTAHSPRCRSPATALSPIPFASIPSATRSRRSPRKPETINSRSASSLRRRHGPTSSSVFLPARSSPSSSSARCHGSPSSSSTSVASPFRCRKRAGPRCRPLQRLWQQARRNEDCAADTKYECHLTASFSFRSKVTR